MILIMMSFFLYLAQSVTSVLPYWGQARMVATPWHSLTSLVKTAADLPTGASNTLRVASPSACYRKCWLLVTFAASIWGVYREMEK